MSNFIQDFDEDDEQFHSTRLSNGSPENGNIHPTTTASKKKRNLPGNPGKLQNPLLFNPDAEVVALSPRRSVAHGNIVVIVAPSFQVAISSTKDSFVTHRAFCDALTEENYRMNQKVLESPQANTNNMMRSEFSHDSNHEKSMSNDFDPILFNQRTLMQPCFISSSGEPNNSLISAGAYTSATALLQKAAEMGAKVSDKTIAPILLRGFSGYSTTNANTTNASGLYDSSLIMPSSKGNNLLERQVFSERMTVDFLGVEPSSVCGKRDYDGNMIGVPYSNDHQHQQSDW
ncbi:hypothetical protein Tco_0896950 [Tanacetum coccineum]